MEGANLRGETLQNPKERSRILTGEVANSRRIGRDGFNLLEQL